MFMVAPELTAHRCESRNWLVMPTKYAQLNPEEIDSPFVMLVNLYESLKRIPVFPCIVRDFVSLFINKEPPTDCELLAVAGGV